MKKIAATLCILGSVVALSACSTTGTSSDDQTAVPYTDSRTAGGETMKPMAPKKMEPAPAEKVFHKAMSK